MGSKSHKGERHESAGTQEYIPRVIDEEGENEIAFNAVATSNTEEQKHRQTET